MIKHGIKTNLFNIDKGFFFKSFMFNIAYMQYCNINLLSNEIIK